jgi:hypothetical protein
LRDNPRACFLVYEAGANPLLWRGCRLYLRMRELADSGPLLASIVAQVTTEAGTLAAQTLRAVVLFDITAIRPLIDRPRRRRSGDAPGGARLDFPE